MRIIKRNNRKGVITIFLSIVISAIIIVNCTYVGLVANLDRGLTLRRAIDVQVNSYLAQYNRQLLKTYGIYGFSIVGIDDNVFRTVMESNGLIDGAVIEVSGMETFDTDDLRIVIDRYYSYRGSGILISLFSDDIKEWLDSVDDSGVLKSLGRFMNSDAADILMNILDGAVSISETLEEAADTLNLDDMAYSVHKFNRLISSLDNIMSGKLNSSMGFDTDDLGFGLDIYNFLDSTFAGTSDFIDEYAFHPCAVNYAVYNFDCRLEDDTAIDGTDFLDFHSRNKSDVEYILTGETGSEARNITESYIYMVLVVKNIIDVYNDEDLKAMIDGIAEVLATVIDIVSAGTVVLSSKVYESVIIFIYALVNASDDLDDLIDGETITFGDKYEVELGYREFVSIFMFFVSDEDLLNRMTRVINRDFDDPLVGISVVGSCNSQKEVELTRRYNIYE